MGERHHTVPQLYLKRFADSSGQIEMIPRLGGPSLLLSIRKAAAETDFYKVQPTDDIPDADARIIEDLLGELEDRANRVIGAVVDGGFPPSDEHRYDLSNFIALQAVRTWAWHADLERATDLAMKAFIRSDIENNAHSAFRPVAKDLDRFLIHFGKNHRLGTMLQHMMEITPCIFGMTWRLYVHDEPSFLTSDEPVGIWRRPGRKEPAGILSADAVYIALSPTHALGLLQSDLPEIRVPGSPTRAHHINLSIASGARRWILRQPGTSLLDGVLLPPIREARYNRVDRWVDAEGKIHELNVMYRG